MNVYNSGNTEKIYIFGQGMGCRHVLRCLRNTVEIIAYIDNYSKTSVTENGIPIIRDGEIREVADFLVISLVQYKQIKNELIEGGFPEDRIICFYDETDAENDRFYKVIDSFKWKTELVWRFQTEVMEPFINNLRYELFSEELKRKRVIPRVIDVEKTIELLINEHKSLVRFGDGEFEMICGRNRPRFQTINKDLTKRLVEILFSNNDEILTAIADNYGNLDKYTDSAAAAIRQYLTPSVRREHFRLLDLDRDYYDAYLSRPYYIYRDKAGAGKRFEQLKKIWQEQDVLIVEGRHTRSGVGNDLFDKATSVKRILCPDKNAFSRYDEILDKALQYGRNRIALSVLGPTATVLSYDLAKAGYWAIDLGQVDTEYEWFLKGTGERSDVTYKTVSEYIDKDVYADIDERYKHKYEDEIVAVID